MAAWPNSADRVVLAHVDDTAIDLLDGQHPVQGPEGARPDLGAHRHRWCAPERVDALLAKYPGLVGELSPPPGLVCEGEQLCPAWRDLIKHPTRFVVGSDTWVNQRWQHYEGLMQGTPVAGRAAGRWHGRWPGSTRRAVWVVST